MVCTGISKFYCSHLLTSAPAAGWGPPGEYQMKVGQCVIQTLTKHGEFSSRGIHTTSDYASLDQGKKVKIRMVKLSLIWLDWTPKSGQIRCKVEIMVKQGNAALFYSSRGILGTGCGRLGWWTAAVVTSISRGSGWVFTWSADTYSAFPPNVIPHNKPSRSLPSFPPSLQRANSRLSVRSVHDVFVCLSALMAALSAC